MFYREINKKKSFFNISLKKVHFYLFKFVFFNTNLKKNDNLIIHYYYNEFEHLPSWQTIS